MLQNVKQLNQAAATVQCEKWTASRGHFHNNLIAEKH
jgi:hypothetical protein